MDRKKIETKRIVTKGMYEFDQLNQTQADETYTPDSVSKTHKTMRIQ